MPILQSRPITNVDPRLDRVLRQLLLCGLFAVLLLPAARGSSAWLGWLPLWLLAMPATAWWALHRFRLPQWQARRDAQVRRRRRSGAQARRRAIPATATARLRAA
jgi:hypothetical protein